MSKMLSSEVVFESFNDIAESGASPSAVIGVAKRRMVKLT